MIEKPCRCGASKKRFKYEIGPFFIDQCCEAAGYDAVGNKTSDKKTPELVSVTTTPLDPAGVLKTPPGRGKLMDMNVPDLKELAKSKGLALTEGLNKKQIVALILS